MRNRSAAVPYGMDEDAMYYGGVGGGGGVRVGGGGRFGRGPRPRGSWFDNMMDFVFGW